MSEYNYDTPAYSCSLAGCHGKHVSKYEFCNPDIRSTRIEELETEIATLRAEIARLQIRDSDAARHELRIYEQNRIIARLEKDAACFVWCQNNPKRAQALMWNVTSRKQRKAAILHIIEQERLLVEALDAI